MGRKLGFEYLPTYITLHCVHGIPQATPSCATPRFTCEGLSPKRMTRPPPRPPRPPVVCRWPALGGLPLS